MVKRYICKAPRCRVERRESNHWFLIWGQNGQFCSAAFNQELLRELYDKGFRVAWVCGHACAQKCYELFLTSQGDALALSQICPLTLVIGNVRS